jgi:hypothetical protein
MHDNTVSPPTDLTVAKVCHPFLDARMGLGVMNDDYPCNVGQSSHDRKDPEMRHRHENEVGPGGTDPSGKPPDPSWNEDSADRAEQ